MSDFFLNLHKSDKNNTNYLFVQENIHRLAILAYTAIVLKAIRFTAQYFLSTTSILSDVISFKRADTIYLFIYTAFILAYIIIFKKLEKNKETLNAEGNFIINSFLFFYITLEAYIYMFEPFRFSLQYKAIIVGLSLAIIPILNRSKLILMFVYFFIINLASIFLNAYHIHRNMIMIFSDENILEIISAVMNMMGVSILLFLVAIIKKKSDIKLYNKMMGRDIENKELSSKNKILERKKMIIDGSSYATYVLDIQKNEIELSSGMRDLMPIEELKIANAIEAWIRRAVPKDRDMVSKAIKSILDGEAKEYSLEYRIIGYDEEPIWVAVRGKCTYDENDIPIYLAGSVIDITKLDKYNEHLESLSLKYRLTGEPNRTRLYMDLADLTKDSSMHGCALLFDIDEFKTINAMYGLSVGDRFIQYIADFLSSKIHENSKLYHLDIDLFLIFFYNATISEINEFVENLRDVSYDGIVVDEKLIKPTFSLGGAFFSSDESAIEVVENAEMALRKVKENGKNYFGMFSYEDKENYIEKIELKTDLKNAVENDMIGFIPYFQPIYSIEKNKIVGAEALVRWKDGRGKIFMPAKIIPLMQSMGIFHIVENWMLNEAAHFCRKWIDMGADKDFMVNINFTPEQAVNKDLKADIFKAMDLNDLEKKNIVVELTEESLVLGSLSNVMVLEELEHSGVRIAIDDFGTGYSSLSYLRGLPAYAIKIDRSFIENIAHDKLARSFVKSIIELSKNMNFIVCVEGVETEEQLKILKTSGADLLQGYYFSYPLIPNEFQEKFINNKYNASFPMREYNH